MDARGADDDVPLRNLRASDDLRLAAGDPVLTSHDDGVVPAGLIVGYVTRASDDDGDGVLDVRVHPLFDLGRSHDPPRPPAGALKAVGLLVLLAWAVVAGAVPDLVGARPGPLGAPPDLYVAMATFLALKGNGVHAVKWGILLGLLADCASLDPLGTHAFVLGTVAFLFARRHGDARAVGGVLVPSPSPSRP